MEELKVGLTGEVSKTVLYTNSANAMGSGDLEVFSTPWMIAIMENAACNAIKECLSDQETSVGIKISTRHVAASAIGENIVAEAKLVEIDGRRLVFEVKAKDGDKEIGFGEHERFIVNKEKFMAKLKK